MKRKILKRIENRYYIFMIVLLLLFAFLFVRLFYIMILKKDVYTDKLAHYGIREIVGASAPRGRILDRNGKVIVDNQGLKTIYYKKNRLSQNEEIELAYYLAEHLDIEISVSEDGLRDYFLLTNGDFCDTLLTDSERKQLQERKLSVEEAKKRKLERIPEEKLQAYTELDREAITIYRLMNKGYSYEEKVLKNKDVTDQEYAFVAENVDSLKGVDVKLDWQREYVYGTTFRSILGSVSSSTTGIPYELKDVYLEKGYSLNERVGTSYLEYQYDSYLHGTPSKYVLEDGTYRQVASFKAGNDLVLTIDIELQKEIEEILEEEIRKTKKEANTEYYNRSMVLLSDPNTGEILAMAGKQILKVQGAYQIYDYTPGIVTAPVTVGSIIKGASLITGYRYGAIDIGTKFYDRCIKLSGTNEKCSWKKGLGVLDDIAALRWSSNSYQYQTALALANVKYQYNRGVTIDPIVFDQYRNTYHEFGLGVKTGIDLPIESSGYAGNTTNPGLLLDFVIGQYEAYTPLQLLQYIKTFVNNGERLQLFLGKEVVDSKGTILYQKEREVLNTIDVEQKYFDRVKLGFRSVMTGPLGYNYVAPKYMAAGKTGTAQSFVDTNGDGKIDTETITSTFGVYAPYEDPKVSMVVVSPDYSHNLSHSSYESNVNRRIARRVMEAYFRRYPVK